MNKFYLLPLLALLGCSGQKSVQPHTSFKDCGHLYHHILEIKVGDSIDPYFVMTPGQRQEAIELLDKEYRHRNTTENFLRYCYQHMTPQQVSCSMSSSSTDDLNNCRL